MLDRTRWHVSQFRHGDDQIPSGGSFRAVLGRLGWWPASTHMANGLDRADGTPVSGHAQLVSAGLPLVEISKDVEPRVRFRAAHVAIFTTRSSRRSAQPAVDWYSQRGRPTMKENRMANEVARQVHSGPSIRRGRGGSR